MCHMQSVWSYDDVIHGSLSILIISPDHPLEAGSGLGTHVFELATGLVEAGCKVTVVAYTPYTSGVIHEAKVDFHLVSLGEGVSRPFDVDWFTDVTSALTTYCETLIANNEYRFDILHCHDWLSFATAHNLRERFGIPLVGSFHLCQSAREKWEDALNKEIALHATLIEQEKVMCHDVDGLITVSQSMRDILTTVCNIPVDKVNVVYNGLDESFLEHVRLSHEEKQSLRRQYADEGEQIVLFVGRLEPRKGVLPLLASAVEVVQEVQGVNYLLVGGPAMNEPVKSFQQVLHMRREHPQVWKRIRMAGKVPRKQLISLYQIADVVVVPSLYEPFGLVAIEAMSFGIPVVATAAGGLQEIIKHGKTGLLVSVHSLNGFQKVDVSGLAKAQIDLLEDKELASRLGSAGQKDVRSRFTRSRMVGATWKVYTQTISRSKTVTFPTI